MPTQLPLPGVDVRPICPVCKHPADVLAQWSPWRPLFVCRECHARLPFDPAWFDASGEWAASVSREAREAYHARLNALSDAAVRRRPIRYALPSVYGIRQLTFPICERCGAPVTLRLSAYPRLCERCEGEDSIRALWRMREVWWQRYADLEDMLDAFYRAFPDLFKLGLLPDMWFELELAET